MAHARAWEVLTPQEREACSHAVGPNSTHENIGIGYATWLRAVQGKLIPKVAAALCRHWIQKRRERAAARMRGDAFT